MPEEEKLDNIEESLEAEPQEVQEAPSVEMPSVGELEAAAETFEEEVRPATEEKTNREETVVSSSEAVDYSEAVTVQPVRFASFEDADQTQGETNKNLDLLMDIKLQLTVELGRTELPIKKVLELTRGSIIELEKVAGEPVELYANGKLVAHGEVVVIEDNFGLRITSITDPDERLKGIQ